MTTANNPSTSSKFPARPANPGIDRTDFDQWARAVRSQMIQALRKKGYASSGDRPSS